MKTEQKDGNFPFVRSLVGQVEPEQFLKKDSVQIGIQSRGEMSKESRRYLETWLGVDLGILDDRTRKLTVEPGRALKVFKLRPPDIIRGLNEGILDLAFLGADYVLEEQLKGGSITPIGYAGFGPCKFSVGFPFTKGEEIPRTTDEIKRVLESGIIVTSLPNTLQYILRIGGIEVNQENLRVMEGSVEAGIALYDAVAVADRVSTGDTMLANGIRPELDLIQFPGAYLVGGKNYAEMYGGEE